jgi:PAS domain S-box-containing protein
MTILIVDDEADARTLLTTMLSASGYNVHAADCGQLALASIACIQPALILLDIHMPGMDGFELLRHLKSRVETKDIPIIILSGSLEPAERVKGLQLGAVDAVTKPFIWDELLARVRTHLDLSKLRCQLEELVAQRTSQVRESEVRFRTMANAAPVKIWSSGPDKLCTFVNKRWLEFTGRNLRQELGNGWVSSIHPDDVQSFCETYTSAIDGHRSFETEFRLRRADAEYRWLLARGVPLVSAGVFTGYIWSAVDITDLKLNSDNMVAAQKLESLGLMAAGVAHDFGNLLGGILAEADLALAEIPEGSS